MTPQQSAAQRLCCQPRCESCARPSQPLTLAVPARWRLAFAFSKPRLPGALRPPGSKAASWCPCKASSSHLHHLCLPHRKGSGTHHCCSPESHCTRVGGSPFAIAAAHARGHHGAAARRAPRAPAPALSASGSLKMPCEARRRLPTCVTQDGGVCSVRRLSFS